MYKISEILKKYSISLIIITVYAVLSNTLFGYFCPSMVLIGLPCPACGLTRAAISLLFLDFRSAYIYNPCVFLVIPLILFYLFLRIYRKEQVKLLFYPTIIIVILSVFVFGYRLIHQFGTEPLVFNERALIITILRHMR